MRERETERRENQSLERERETRLLLEGRAESRSVDGRERSVWHAAFARVSRLVRVPSWARSSLRRPNGMMDICVFVLTSRSRVATVSDMDWKRWERVLKSAAVAATSGYWFFQGIAAVCRRALPTLSHHTVTMPKFNSFNTTPVPAEEREDARPRDAGRVLRLHLTEILLRVGFQKGRNRTRIQRFERERERVGAFPFRGTALSAPRDRSSGRFRRVVLGETQNRVV